MRLRITILLAGLMTALLVAPGTAHAEPPLPGCTDISGDWRNIDGQTRSITRAITSTDCYSSYHGTAHLYGQCSPTDCNWGTTRIDQQSDGAWTGKYVTSFATRYIWLKTSYFSGVRYLRVYVQSHYNDGRADNASDDWMLPA